MGKSRSFLILSGIVVLASLVATLTIGPKFGIDFMGGTEIQVAFQKPAASADIRATVTNLGFDSCEVVTFGAHESEYLIRLQAISPVDDALAAAAEQSFKGQFPDAKLSRFEFSPGGDKLTIRISKDVPISAIEKAVTDSKLELGVVDETLKDTDKKDSDPSAVEDVEEAANAESEEEAAGLEEDVEESKKCESVTCMWPYQDAFVYEVNLKGVSERVMEGLRATDFGAGAIKMRSEWVGPKVGKQLRTAGISSLVYALLFIMLYIAVRFDLRFAPGAVVALIHDVLITMGIFTLARVEVTLATVAALLTIVGYSLNDTIVVFDRIRENLGRIKERKLSQVINLSINQTLSRTLLTSITTLIAVVAILSIGWKTTIRDFAFALLVGVLVGTYSSIFVASPIVVWLDTKLGKKKA